MIPELTNNLITRSTTDPKEVAAKVQEMLVEIMLKAMEESVDAEEGLFGNSLSADIYRGMLRQHLASTMSETMQSPLEKAVESAIRSTDAKPKGVEKMPVYGVVSSREEWRSDPFNGEMRYHSGTDIAAEGTTIQAVAAGLVIESGVKRGYGNMVIIQGRRWPEDVVRPQ